MIIFISYNSANYARAQALAVQLGMLDHDVRFEQKMLGGDVGWHQVFESIKDCDVFVFGVTRISLESYAEQVEYCYANALGKPILPVLLEDISIQALPSELNAVPYINYVPGNVSTSLLADTLTHLPAVNSSANVLALRPELITPLSQLLNQANMPPEDEAKQFVLFYNLREFLERYETFHDAKDILLQLQSNPRVSEQVSEEIGKTFKEIRRLGIQRGASRKTRQFFRDATLVVVVPLFLFIMVRVVQFVPSLFKSAGNTQTVSILTATLQSASTVLSSATPVSTLIYLSPTPEAQIVDAAQSSGNVAQSEGIEDVALEVPTSTLGIADIATSAATLTDLPTNTLTPIPTDTPTITPSATNTPTATLTPLPPTLPALGKPTYVGIQVEDTDQGVRVSNVRNSASDAGVKNGDYLVAVNYQIIRNSADFHAVIDTLQPYSVVNFRFSRDGQEMFVQLTLNGIDFVVSPVS